MKILVSAASRHGSTAEIAAAIARTLLAKGLLADVVAPEQVRSLEGYDAVVLGSAVYMGRWLESARRVATERQANLRSLPVWLFSSGPIGDPPMPTEDPVDAAQVAALTGAREHRLFGGVVDRRRLALTEKAIVTMLRAPDGDFRQWNEIDEWAARIASALEAQPVVRQQPVQMRPTSR